MSTPTCARTSCARLTDALGTGRSLQGAPVAQLEAELAQRCRRDHAVCVGSGTDALTFALVAAGIGPGDEVIVPALSFIASASCVLQAGARPRFADVDASGMIDLDDARRLIGERTRAIIAVQLYGQMTDSAGLESLAASHGIELIEDAAQAFGAERSGRPAGSVGSASCLSFDPTKPLAAPGSGGALLCDDEALAERVRALRWHGRDASGSYATLGGNSQLPSLAAAVLLRKLERSREWTERRAEIAAAYDTALTGDSLVPVARCEGRHAFHKYVVRTPHGRDALRERLAAAGIPTFVHYARVLADEPVFACPDLALPGARALAGEVLSLPIHPYLSDSEIERVAHALGAVTG